MFRMARGGGVVAESFRSLTFLGVVAPRLYIGLKSRTTITVGNVRYLRDLHKDTMRLESATMPRLRDLVFQPILFVRIDTVFLQYFSVFVLKIYDLVMFPLSSNVGDDTLFVGFAHGKRGVLASPSNKIRKNRMLFFQPGVS